MVDISRATRILAHLANDLVYLHELATQRSLTASDRHRLNGAKYRFITVIEASIDVSMHLIASEAWGVPKANADAMNLLADNGVVTAELAGQMRDAVGFRNLLVHEYDIVDDERVLGHLDDLGILDEFVGSVGRWISEQS